MTATVEQFLAANDNADLYAESLMDGLAQSALEEIDDLSNEPDNRDEDLWLQMGVDPELTVDDYEVEPVPDRGLNWTTGIAGIAAASQTQFFLDNRQKTIIEPTAYREQVLSAVVLTRAQYIQAGKRSVEVITEAHFRALQAKFTADFAYLTEYTNLELYTALTEIGAIKPAEQAIADAAGYVSRMTSYRPGSIQFKGEVSRLIDSSAQNLRWMNRRAVERLNTWREADGNLDTEMVWIGERGAHNCQYCPPNFGLVKTYRQWIEDGLPGSDVCAGGDRCKCHLASA